MLPVQFSIFKTHELSAAHLASIVKNFNFVFEKDLPPEDFMRQYINTAQGFSWHSLMLADEEVVGYLSAIPYRYKYFGHDTDFCYIGGLYILPAYRKNPVALYKMYSGVREVMMEAGIAAALAVPNKNSYPYFIHALKWKEAGTLPYHALPVRFANVTGKFKLLNLFSRVFSTAFNISLYALAAVRNSRVVEKNIRLPRAGDAAEKQRYGAMHRIIKTKNAQAFFRPVEEDGIRTVYLIDWNNGSGERDLRSLTIALRKIMASEKPDLLLFIGPLGVHPAPLFKVPKAKEPRPLNFCIDILQPDLDEAKILDADNWDFGLYNFDVR